MSGGNIIVTRVYESPCGVLLLGSLGDELCLCDWRTTGFVQHQEIADGHLTGVGRQFAYADGSLAGVARRDDVLERRSVDVNWNRGDVNRNREDVGRDRGDVDRRVKKVLRAEYEPGSSDVIEEAVRELDGYFAGRRREFDVPLLFAGTDFQKKVWAALLDIPYGETLSYGEIARRIGAPSAVRAVAGAIGANPMSIFVPCHRVIGSNKSLTGYAGGLEAKRRLLELETPGRFWPRPEGQD